jgi:sugar/nucleoside kinase (ribokinase family)
VSHEDLGGWPGLRGKDPDSDGKDPDVERWDEIKRIFKQIPPEDRRGVRWWLIEGHSFGEEDSREHREHLARVCFEGTVRLTERLERLIKRHWKEIHAACDVLLGMDLESERLSELHEQQ